MSISVADVRTAYAKGKGQSALIGKELPNGTSIQFLHPFQKLGAPGAGVYGGAKAPVQFDGDYASPSHNGLLLFQNAVSPEKLYLSHLLASLAGSNGFGTLHLLDLLVEYGGFNANSAATQATTSSAGSNDLPRHTDGVGVVAFADVQTTLGVTPTTLDIVYTDEDDNTGNTSQSVTTIGSAPQGKLVHSNVPFIPLAAGDKGIKSVQSAKLNAAMGAGTFAVVLAKLIASIVIPETAQAKDQDFVNLPPFLQELPDDVALSFLWAPADTNTGTLNAVVNAIAVDPDA